MLGKSLQTEAAVKLKYPNYLINFSNIPDNMTKDRKP